MPSTGIASHSSAGCAAEGKMPEPKKEALAGGGDASAENCLNMKVSCEEIAIKVGRDRTAW